MQHTARLNNSDLEFIETMLALMEAEGSHLGFTVPNLDEKRLYQLFQKLLQSRKEAHMAKKLNSKATKKSPVRKVAGKKTKKSSTASAKKAA